MQMDLKELEKCSLVYYVLELRELRNQSAITNFELRELILSIFNLLKALNFFL
jgi:hypothetical protein